MSHPHPLHISIEDRSRLEGVHPDFISAGLMRAREKTIQVLELVRNEFKEGMTEEVARKLAMDIFADHGVTKHWHRLYVRFGPGTILTFNDPVQPDYRLQENDPYYLDLGPVWKDAELGLEYEGDYGDTFVFGENAEANRCAQAARDLFAEAKQFWATDQSSGEAIYERLKRRTVALGYELVEGVEGQKFRFSPSQNSGFSKS
jgi:hypothetical protein